MIDFPQRDHAYLNTAAQGLWPVRTSLAVQEVAVEMQTIGPDRDGERAVFGQCREQLAAFVGAGPDDIVLLPSTSHGLNTALQGIDWRPGDNVVLPEREFPAVQAAAGNLAARGVTIRVAPYAGIGATPAELLACSDSRTRAVVCSGIAWNTGYRMDLAALGPACTTRGILTIIDGVQMVGAEPLALAEWKISVLAFHGYKWLMAGFGIGGAYISPRAIDQIQPVFVGTHGLAAPINLANPQLQFKPGAARYALGGPGVLGAVALHASMSLLGEIGVAGVSLHNHMLADRLVAGLAVKLPGARILRAPDPVNQSAIVVFSLGETTRDKALVDELETKGVWAAQRAMGIRVSPHIYNDDADIDKLLAAIY